MKVIPFIITILLFTNPLHAETLLRVPVGEAETRERMDSKVGRKIIEELGDKGLRDLVISYIRAYISSHHIPNITPEDIEDIAQIVLLKIDKGMDGFKKGDRSSFDRWVYAITRNTIVEGIRKDRREEKDRMRIVPLESTLRQDYAWLEFLRQNLDFLAERQREIVRLYLEGKNLEQIARVIDIPSGYIQTLYRFAIVNIVWGRKIQEEKFRCLKVLRENPALLSESNREPTELWFEGKSLEEIMKELNLTYEATHSRIRRGRQAVGYKEPDEREFYKKLLAQVGYDILTDRQREVMKLWLDGKSYQSIADADAITCSPERFVALYAKVKLIKASGIFREMYDEDAGIEAEEIVTSARRNSSHI